MATILSKLNIITNRLRGFLLVILFLNFLLFLVLLLHHLLIFFLKPFLVPMTELL